MGSEEGNDACTIQIGKGVQGKDEDDNASQTLRKSNKSNTKIGWNSLFVRKESLHNTGKQWASGHQAPRETAFCWTTDQH
jgi:hypothetical protein